MSEKKDYESPVAEKLEFNFSTTVTASGFGAGNDAPHGENNEQVSGIFVQGSCETFKEGDECFGC